MKEKVERSGLPDRNKNFSAWYNRIVLESGLADYGEAKGTVIFPPYGYAIWENIVKAMDGKIKAAGVSNTYFPLFIPMHLLQKEQDHVEGFSPHMAIVTHGGGKKLEEPLVVRPTSETVMYPYYSKIVKSWRDLPILYNQWNNVVRWEQRTTLFLRTTEFLWQEGHTAHATHEEAWNEVLRALSMYKEVYRDYLAIPGYAGMKSNSEKFAGADATTTLELLMPDGKALQGCTSHDLGQNFSKTFDIKFQDKDGKNQYAWQTSWGFTTRSIGAMIMVHGDNKGLRVPPRIAPTQVVVVPIPGKNSVDIKSQAREISEILTKAGIRTRIDDDERETPGAKFNRLEKIGVPVRIEIGDNEVYSSDITVYRRDLDKRINLTKSFLNEEVPALLDDIHNTMLSQATAFLTENTRIVDSYDEFKEQMSSEKGFLYAYWCEDPACEDSIKEETKASTRCLPFDSKDESGYCIHCNREAKRRWIFAQSY